MGAVNQRAAPSVDAVVAEIDAAVERIAEARAAIGKVIYGQGEVIDQALTTILSGGHGLLVGVSRPEQLSDAVAAVKLKLDGEEIAALEAPYRPHPVVGF